MTEVGNTDIVKIANRRGWHPGRIWQRIDKVDGGCWLWRGPRGQDGYAHVWVGGGSLTRTKVYLHRWVYEQEVGSIPEGLVLDHLCRVRHCVNPAHLEPVTMRVNILRGDAPPARNAKVRNCLHGHRLDGANLYLAPSGRRRCRACQSAAGRKYRDHLANVTSR